MEILNSNSRLCSYEIHYYETDFIDFHIFLQLFELERLNISHNNLTTLRPNALENARLLKEIDLSSNQIVCDCDLRWLKNWHVSQ